MKELLTNVLGANEKLQEIKNAIGAKSLIEVLQILNNKNENYSVEEDVQELILRCFLEEDIDRLFKEFVRIENETKI